MSYNIRMKNKYKQKHKTKGSSTSLRGGVHADAATHISLCPMGASLPLAMTTGFSYLINHLKHQKILQISRSKLYRFRAVRSYITPKTQ